MTKKLDKKKEEVVSNSNLNNKVRDILFYPRIIAPTIKNFDATTSNKGIASFNSDEFSVSSGDVSLATTTKVQASLTSNQSISNNTETTVIFNNEILDNLSEYNTSTGVFTVNKDGFYWIYASCLWANQVYSVDDLQRIIIRQNSSNLVQERFEHYEAGTYYKPMSIGTAADLSSGDTIDIRVLQITGDTVELHSGGGQYTRLTIFRIQ